MSAIRRALISVSDKANILDLAAELHARDVEILSTGGTARLLAENGIPVIEVSDYTGFPEMMDGRIKTLHPKIHGGVLGRRGTDDAVMTDNGIQPIDLVVVNLYPFEQAVARPDCDLATAIENIDIGGPTLLRAAAKNHAHVAVVVNPEDYGRIINEMQLNQGAISDATRFALSVKAFEHTARYDAVISSWLARQGPEETGAFPAQLNLQFSKSLDLRYGENPHQQAAFYIEQPAIKGSIAAARQVQGKNLSFNNIADADAALECVKGFADTPACVIVKHANPCGVAVGNTLLEAYDRAYTTDPTSAFGGIIAFNRTLDCDTTQAILDRQFVEVVIAAGLDDKAREMLAKKSNVRMLVYEPAQDTANPRDYKRVSGGLLVQDSDHADISPAQLKTVTRREPSEGEHNDLLFAWKVVKYVKSNAIVYGRDGMTLGIGAGQMSRIDSCRIATLKSADAGLELRGAAMASDAFFPFRDTVDTAAKAGITAIIQPGGSIRDQEVIDAADEHGITMLFTGVRHFRH